MLELFYLGKILLCLLKAALINTEQWVKWLMWNVSLKLTECFSIFQLTDLQFGSVSPFSLTYFSALTGIFSMTCSD